MKTKQQQLLLYKDVNNEVKVEVCFIDETIWLTQKDIAKLFGVGIPAINKHLNNIYDDKELIKTSTISKMEIVRKEGKRHINI